MQMDNRGSYYRFIVSLFCATVLVLQATTVAAAWLGRPLFSWYWPIIDYPMYDQPHSAGEYVNATYLVEGTLSDGSVVNIGRDDMGLNRWDFLHLVAGLRRDDPKAVDRLRSLYRKGDQLVEIRIKTLPVIITKRGMEKRPPMVLKRLAMTPEGRHD